MFGGTFDPVHNAHLQIARAAAGLLNAPKVLFIPANRPPHKSRGTHASFEDRAAMLQLACGADPRFEVSLIEAGTAMSYSIDTIEKLKPRGRLAFLIGADAFAEIATWYRWPDVVASVRFVVVSRPGAKYNIPPGAQVTELSGLALDESSSDVRRRIRDGALAVPVPDSVLDYIRRNGLYVHTP